MANKNKMTMARAKQTMDFKTVRTKVTKNKSMGLEDKRKSSGAMTTMAKKKRPKGISFSSLSSDEKARSTEQGGRSRSFNRTT